MDPEGAPSLSGVISGMVAIVGSPVDVAVPSAGRVVPVIRLVVPVPEKVESVLSGEEVESKGGVTES